MYDTDGLYSVNRLWVKSSAVKGDDKMNKNHITFSYKGFGWNSFYNSWLAKFKLFKEKTCSFEDSIILFNWIDNIVDNYVKDRNTFEKQLDSLNIESLETIIRITDRFDNQFELLLNKCVNIESCRNTVNFLEDLPYRLNEIIEELEQNQVLLFNDVEYKNKTYESVNQEYKEGNKAHCVENVGICQHFLFL